MVELTVYINNREANHGWWKNFRGFCWDSLKPDVTAYSLFRDTELEKYNARYDVQHRSLMFASESDLTVFLLKWS